MRFALVGKLAPRTRACSDPRRRYNCGFMSKLRKLGDAFLRRLDKPVSGDPLYVSNRTPAQKFRTLAFVVGPFLLIVVLVVVVQWAKPPAPAPQTLSPAEIAAKMLPDLSKVPVETNREVSVGDVQIERSSNRVTLVGTVKNPSGRKLRRAEVLFWLADGDGSVLGSATAHAKDIPAGGATGFRIVLPFKTAEIAIVRDVHGE
jgi:hypothetical protein